MFSRFKPSNENLMERVPKEALGEVRDLKKYVSHFLVELDDDQRKHALDFVIGFWLSICYDSGVYAITREDYSSFIRIYSLAFEVMNEKTKSTIKTIMNRLVF